jgi:chromosomal replication initiation ATPase DnaA
MTAQLTLPWQWTPVFNEESFFVAPNNQDAYQMVRQNGESLAPGALFLWGEKACGKTHLAHLWAVKTRALFLRKEDLSPLSLLESHPQAAAYVLDDIQNICDETALFHLLNLVKEHQSQLLITSRVSASCLPFILPDLCSRLRALPSITITLPDEISASAFLYKRFSDMHMKPPKGFVEHILTRAPRTYTDLDHLTRRLWEASLKEKRRPSTSLLKEILDERALVAS